MPPRKLPLSPTAATSEAKTRKDLIDPALKKAGWDVDNRQQVGIEIPVDGFAPDAWHALNAELKRIRDPQCKPLVQLCLSPQLATASVDQLNQVIDTLSGQMRYRKDKENSFIKLDLPDFIEMRGYILLKGGSEPVYIEAYRQRVEQRIVALIDANPAIEAISRGASLSDDRIRCWQTKH